MTVFYKLSDNINAHSPWNSVDPTSDPNHHENTTLGEEDTAYGTGYGVNWNPSNFKG